MVIGRRSGCSAYGVPIRQRRRKKGYRIPLRPVNSCLVKPSVTSVPTQARVTAYIPSARHVHGVKGLCWSVQAYLALFAKDLARFYLSKTALGPKVVLTAVA